MPTDHPATAPRVAVRASNTTLFASLELSKAGWLVTVSAPGGEKLSGTPWRAVPAARCSTFSPG